MNKQEQREAIAEACGWMFDYIRDGAMYYVPSRDIHVGDPITDLNAMHEAEKIVLSNLGIWTRYVQELKIQSAKTGMPLFHIPAAQRAEAFLKTIGKLKES